MYDHDVAIVTQQRGQIREVKVYPFDRIADAMTDLGAGRITAVMKVYPVAAWLARRTPDLRIVAQVPDNPQPLGVGKQDGAYARLARKWGVP